MDTTSLWDAENFASLVEAQERETGEWLGSDAIISHVEDDEPSWINGDDDFDVDGWAEERALARYERGIYGD